MLRKKTKFDDFNYELSINNAARITKTRRELGKFLIKIA